MTSPAVSEHVTKAATALVLDVLGNKRCPNYLKERRIEEAAKSIGLHAKQRKGAGDMTLGEMLERELRHRGKFEYEVEAIEDVLIMWDRWRRES